MSERGTQQFEAMPPASPLAMPPQDLRSAPRPRQAGGSAGRSGIWRVMLFGSALVTTVLLLMGLHRFLAAAGMSGMEWLLIALIGMTFVWVTLSVSTVGIAVAGLVLRGRGAHPRRENAEALNVALLVPIYNEVPWEVFGNAAAMLDDLARRSGVHRYTLYVLSDTRDAQIALQEERAFARLAEQAALPVHYRRRMENTDKKVGNLMDWITRWGGAHEAMVVLDADSLMSGRAIERLADELASDADAGLIQSFPMLIGAQTVFARMQQFSNIAYGWLLAEGLAIWSRAEGNYWGHNAIIRISAFAGSAGLPHLQRGGRDELILSHDFVEAGLLRRAGWRVRFLPRLTGSFEETPGTLIDYVLRDRRWCRGNLQHLRLLGTAGLHPVSRFHLFHGAVSYLLSPAWFVLLVIWALLGKDTETNVIRYFNEANPLFPDWPPAMSHIDSAVFLLIMYAMLLVPKMVAAALISARPAARRVFGGQRAFLRAFAVEVVLSVAYAPVLMIQQTKAVLACPWSGPEPWTPQCRTARGYPLGVLLRFHWLETVLGALLVLGLLAGLVSLWLIPIAASLILATPLSALSAMRPIGDIRAALALDSPHSLREPQIVTRARAARDDLRQHLTAQIPAE